MRVNEMSQMLHRENISFFFFLCEYFVIPLAFFIFVNLSFTKYFMKGDINKKLKQNKLCHSIY